MTRLNQYDYGPPYMRQWVKDQIARAALSTPTPIETQPKEIS